MAETISDQFTNGGWLDSGGAENGDKCAWISSGQGASADISLSTGTFAVQSLWSNAFNNNSGGCVLTYP
jgi:serine protease